MRGPPLGLFPSARFPFASLGSVCLVESPGVNLHRWVEGAARKGIDRQRGERDREC